MSHVEEIYESVLKGVDPLLAPEGFKRSGICFRKRLQGGNVRWCICFQKTRYSTENKSKFTLWIHAEWKRRPASYEDWEPRTTWYGGAGGRIGELMPSKEDTWWDINEGTSAPLLSAQINAVLGSCALPFLRQFENEENIKSYLKALANDEMEFNYPHALSMLSFDLFENKEPSVLQKAIDNARRLRKINKVDGRVIEADIQRVLSSKVE